MFPLVLSMHVYKVTSQFSSVKLKYWLSHLVAAGTVVGIMAAKLNCITLLLYQIVVDITAMFNYSSISSSRL